MFSFACFNLTQQPPTTNKQIFFLASSCQTLLRCLGNRPSPSDRGPEPLLSHSVLITPYYDAWGTAPHFCDSGPEPLHSHSIPALVLLASQSGEPPLTSVTVAMNSAFVISATAATTATLLPLLPLLQPCCHYCHYCNPTATAATSALSHYILAVALQPSYFSIPS